MAPPVNKHPSAPCNCMHLESIECFFSMNNGHLSVELLFPSLWSYCSRLFLSTIVVRIALIIGLLYVSDCAFDLSHCMLRCISSGSKQPSESFFDLLFTLFVLDLVYHASSPQLQFLLLGAGTLPSLDNGWAFFVVTFLLFLHL